MALWTPEQITTELWLDAADTSTITLESGAVSQWNDKSGNGRNLSQATPSLRPLYDGDNNCLTASGDGKYMGCSLSGIEDGTINEYTLFVVATPAKTSDGDPTQGNTGTGYYSSDSYNSHVFSVGGNSVTTSGPVTPRFSLTTNLLALTEERHSLAPWLISRGHSVGANRMLAMWERTSSRATRSGINGVYAAGATGTVTNLSWTGLYCPMRYTTSSYWSGGICEVLLIHGILSAEEIQLVEGSLMWKWGLESSLSADHPYKSAAPTIPYSFIYAYLEQPYVIEPNVLLGAALEQTYNIDTVLLQAVLSQRYGDVPWLTPVLLQPYGDAPWLIRPLEQPYGDALGLESSLDQPWMMPETLQSSLRQPYGIAAEILATDLHQPYNLNPYDILSTDLAQPYAISGEETRLHRLDTKLYVDGIRFPYYLLEWQATDGEYAWYCTFSTKNRAAAQRCVDGAAIRIDHMGESYHFRCYGGWMLDRRHADDVYRVEGYSRTKDLDKALPLTGEIAGGMASAIVASMADPYGIEVLWEMADGFIASGKLSAGSETPLAIIGRIVHDAEGILQSTPDGKLLVVAAEETPIPDYPTAPVAATIAARLERISTSEHADEQPGYNRIEVSDQTSVAGQRALDYVEIDSRTREVRLFVTPLAGRSFALLHSGGTPVTIEPCGRTTLAVDDEQVEVVAGSGRTTKPVHAVRSMAWQRDDLGGVAWSEDGVLSAATPGYSLLKISYDSYYIKWICRSDDITDVQFRAVEVTGS